MTEGTKALVDAVRAFLRTADAVGQAWTGHPHIPGEISRMAAPLQEALEAFDSETCNAEMDHHHGLLTCTRTPGHAEARHRDYLRGEWNYPAEPSGNSLAERLNR